MIMFHCLKVTLMNIDWCHSALRDANLGVSQGSMLGLILFLIFINNLPKILEYSAAEICADDTTISANVDYRSAPGVLNQILQAHVGKVAQWTTDSKMVLNESKTKAMLLADKRLHKTMSSTSLTVHVNSVELEQVQFHKLLGVIINTQLNFNKDIDDLCKKVTQRIAVLKKLGVTAVTPQNVILTQNVIRIAAKCNNVDAKCNKIFNAECNNLSTQIVITFLTHNVITQNVIISE